MEAPTTDLERIKKLVDDAKDILILTHGHPSFDSMGSALSLYLGLTSLGKNVTVGCPTPMTVEFSDFVGANKLQTTFTKKNFVIALDYEDGSIDKVSYHIDGNTFNLVIEPRPGFEEFSEKKVHFKHTGTSADVIFTIDTMHLGELGDFYEGEKDLFATRPIVNVDAHPQNSEFGAINMTGHGAATTAEIVAVILSHLGVKLTEDIATNILNAIYISTHNFEIASARTFEVAAVCMRSGGKRFTPSVKPVELPHTEPAVLQEKPAPTPVPPVAQPTSVTDEPPKQEAVKEPPEDWLKPKIFKTSTIA